MTAHLTYLDPEVAEIVTQLARAADPGADRWAVGWYWHEGLLDATTANGPFETRGEAEADYGEPLAILGLDLAGEHAHRMGVRRYANPLTHDLDRDAWDTGWVRAEEAGACEECP